MMRAFLLLATIGLSNCIDGVVIEIEDYPPGTAGIRVQAAIDGVPIPIATNELPGAPRLFVVQPRSRKQGTLSVSIEALEQVGAGACSLGTGSGSTDIELPAHSVPSIRVAIAATETRRCPIELTVHGAPPQEVVPATLHCLPSGEKRTRCTGYFVEGEQLALRVSAPSYNLHWSAGCVGNVAECTRVTQLGNSHPPDQIPTLAEARLWRSELPSNLSLRSVSAAPANDVWGVGLNGSIAHFDGEVWRTCMPGSDCLAGIEEPLPELHAVHCSGQDVWIAGAAGTVYQRTGGRWLKRSLPAEQAATLRGIWATAEGQAWAVGDDMRIAYFNAGAGRWQLQDPGRPAADRVGTTLRAISGAKSTYGAPWLHIAGDEVLLESTDGVSWSTSFRQPGFAPRASFSLNQEDHVAVGTQGKRASARFCTRVLCTETYGAGLDGFMPLNGIWGSDVAHFWAVGMSGTILLREGVTWHPHAGAPSGVDLYGVDGVGATELWIVGDQGTALLFPIE